MKKIVLILLIILPIFSCEKVTSVENKSTDITTIDDEGELTFIGHASFKIKSKDGVVIYVDPFYGSKDNYSEPADFIFVTHSHFDHNKINLVAQKESTKIISAEKSVPNKKNVIFILPYKNEILTDMVSVETFPAINNNHKKENNFLGFIFTIGGKKLYIAGDTSFFNEMDELADRNIDYAFLPIDGQFNMDAAEASMVADHIKATYSIPIHTGLIVLKPIFDEKKVENFKPTESKKMVLKYGENFIF